MEVSTSDVTLSILTNPELNVDRIAPRRAPAAESPTSTAGFLSRQHIMEATEGCFAEVGYDGTTIRAIAGRLGCAVGSIYRYFDDKNALLLACASRVIEPVARELKAGAGLEASVSLYVEQARRHTEMYSLLMWLGGRMGGVASVIGEVLGGWSALVGGESAARQLWARVHGLLLLGTARDEIMAAALGREVEAKAAVEPEAPVVATAPVVAAGVGATASGDDMTLL